MKTRFIYGVIPVIVLISDVLLPKRFAAYCYGFLIVVRPNRKDTNILIEHELVHSKQIVRMLGLHSILYYLSRKYRLKAELEAYRVQMSAGGWKAEITHKVIGYLYKNYNLNISREEVEDAVYSYYWG